MLLLVLADNLLLTFVGWEGVGVCSYWLVAFWFQRESAASAGKKAFIYNRIGDAGFLLAIFLIFEKTGTVQYESGPGGGIFGQLSHLHGRCRPRRRAAPVPGRRRQVGPDPAVQLAARRHGGPDPGLGAHPRRHHGHGRGLPAVPDEPVAARDGDGVRDHRHHRGRDRLHGGHHRLRAAGHQEGAGLLDRLADRLHDPRRGHRCLHRRRLPHGGPRLLQGPALPGRRLGDPRARGRAGPQAHGRAAPLHEVDHGHLHHRVPGHRRHPAALGLLGQGRRARQHVRPLQVAVGHRPDHRRADGVLHEPARDPRLRGQGALRQGRPARGAGPAHAARVALGHAPPARRPRLLRLLRRRARPALGAHRQPVELPGPGVRRHALQRSAAERGRNGRWPWPTSRPRSSG